MNFSRAAAAFIVWAAVCSPAIVAGQTSGTPSVRQVHVLGNRNVVEVEIESSDRLVPKAQVLSNPDRLVVDFDNAVPGLQLRNQAINRGGVKGVRVGLFASNPPVTRLVFDLSGQQPYEMFPNGKTVIVKVGGPAGAQAAPAYKPVARPSLVNTNYSMKASDAAAPVLPAAPQKPALEVVFRNGLLSINSDKATLSEVLFAVHQRTGADIAIPAGSEQEKVVVDIGPAPAPAVLAELLNGSKFNFLILSSASHPGALDRVILSSRPEGAMQVARAPAQPLPQAEEEAEVEVPTKEPPPVPAANPSPAPEQKAPPAGPPETKAPGDTDVPD